MVLPFRSDTLHAVDGQIIELRLTDGERNVHIAVAYFMIAIHDARTATECAALHRRLSGLVLALGAVEDAALIRQHALEVPHA